MEPKPPPLNFDTIRCDILEMEGTTIGSVDAWGGRICLNRTHPLVSRLVAENEENALAVLVDVLTVQYLVAHNEGDILRPGLTDNVDPKDRFAVLLGIVLAKRALKWA